MINNFINSEFLLIALVTTPIFLAIAKKKNHLIIPLLAIYLITWLAGLTTKRITAIPRPFNLESQVLGVTSNIPQDYSFPSLHTMMLTMAAWLLVLIDYRLSWLGFTATLLIGVSRVSLGLHRFNEVFFGFIIATIIFWLFFYTLNPKELLKAHSSLNRKLVHLFFGLILVFLLNHQLFNLGSLILILLLMGLFMVIINFPPFGFLKKLVLYFERDKDALFPGLGVLWYLLSSLIAFLAFPKAIALAAIVNLATGDSLNAITGYFYGPTQKKLIGPTLTAFFISWLMMMNFVSPLKAFAGAATVSVLEFLGAKIQEKKFDDNIWIPIVSGLTMLLVG